MSITLSTCRDRPELCLQIVCRLSADCREVAGRSPRCRHRAHNGAETASERLRPRLYEQLHDLLHPLHALDEPQHAQHAQHAHDGVSLEDDGEQRRDDDQAVELLPRVAQVGVGREEQTVGEDHQHLSGASFGV